MCLITSRPKPYVAEVDIFVKKILAMKEGKLVTPYMETEVNLDEFLVAEADTSTGNEKGTSLTNPIGGCEYSVGEGMVHAYSLKNYDECLVALGEAGRAGYPVIAYTAIIPKGTEFFCNDECTEVAAERLFITSDENLMDRTVFSSNEYLRRFVLDNIDEEVSNKRVLLSNMKFVTVGEFIKNQTGMRYGSHRPIGIEVKEKGGLSSVMPIEPLRCYCEYGVKMERGGRFSMVPGYYVRADGFPTKFLSVNESVMSLCRDFRAEGTERMDWEMPSDDALRHMLADEPIRKACKMLGMSFKHSLYFAYDGHKPFNDSDNACLYDVDMEYVGDWHMEFFAFPVMNVVANEKGEVVRIISAINGTDRIISTNDGNATEAKDDSRTLVTITLGEREKAKKVMEGVARALIAIACIFLLC